jgi:hypothetical protein
MKAPRWMTSLTSWTAPRGNATIPYPPFATRHDASAFDQCESRLLWEIQGAEESARELNALGADAPSFVVPWLISPGQASNGVAEDTKGWGPSRTDMQAVVDWLVDAGALRPMSESRRSELVLAGQARRAARDPDGRIRGLEPEHAESREAFSREIDHDSWEVVPSVMIEVYPELTSTGTAWSELDRAPRP